MVLLNAPSRIVTVPRLAAALAAVVAGCVVFDAVTGAPGEVRTFDHRRHVAEEGLDCTSCHLGAEDDDRPGMPVLAQCRLCHEEPEEEGGPDPTAGLFDAEGNYARPLFTALSDELLFSHSLHVAADLECAACHGDVGESTRFDASVAVVMQECSTCHASSGAPNECATCHTEVGPGWTPPTHARGWIEAHGPSSRDPIGSTDECALCHQERTCTACHFQNPPRDHTNNWRRRGHGAGAILDRDRCTTCHRTDTCQACHENTQPASHIGSWGGRRSTHCLGCHLPSSQEEGCFLCHQGAPSHALASPLPPDHVPGMDCRQCHGLTAPLPHVDNGDACGSCHK